MWDLVRLERGCVVARLDGKVAFITGVARGQGRSHALRLAEAGADFMVADVWEDMLGCLYRRATADDLEVTVKAVEATGRRIVVGQADVRDQGQLDAVVAEGVEAFGGLDIVCANAGIAGRG